MLANREKSISHLQELNKKHGQRILKALNERKEHINISEIDLSYKLLSLAEGDVDLKIGSLEKYKEKSYFESRLQDVISSETDEMLIECDYMEGLSSELLAFDLGYNTAIKEQSNKPLSIFEAIKKRYPNQTYISWKELEKDPLDSLPELIYNQLDDNSLDNLTGRYKEAHNFITEVGGAFSEDLGIEIGFYLEGFRRLVVLETVELLGDRSE